MAAQKNRPNGIRGANSYSKSSLFASQQAASGQKATTGKKKGGTTSSEARAAKLNGEVSAARRSRKAAGNF